MLIQQTISVFEATSIPWRAATGGIFGAIVGSYLATVLMRWPRGDSANNGRSLCDGCGRRLAAYELIPIVSYVFLRGRCATCDTRISPLHITVEAICGLLGAYIFALGLPTLAPLAWLLLLLGLFDARMLWLPDRLVFPLALVCLFVPGWDAGAGLPARLLAGAIGFIALWSIGRGFRAVTGRTGLGGGDPKLFGAIGLWLGARDLPLLMLAACAIGLIDALLRWPKGADRHDVHLPLGAYLCLAALCFVVAQPLRQDSYRPFSSERSDETAAAKAEDRRSFAVPVDEIPRLSGSTGRPSRNTS